LAQSRSTNTKQTLAYSLHEVARILGEGKLVEEELVPVFEEMIQVIPSDSSHYFPVVIIFNRSGSGGCADGNHKIFGAFSGNAS
jgi:hypothetical protein